jgi:hypothetical protein
VAEIEKEILATENTEILKYYLLLPSLFFVNTANHFYILIWNKFKLGKLKNFLLSSSFFSSPLSGDFARGNDVIAVLNFLKRIISQ